MTKLGTAYMTAVFILAGDVIFICAAIWGELGLIIGTMAAPAVVVFFFGIALLVEIAWAHKYRRIAAGAPFI